MGKIYKNTATTPTPTKPDPIIISKTVSPTPKVSLKEIFNMPKAQVLPIEHFDSILQSALNDITDQQHYKALEKLVNLEVTDFNNIQVHELLADMFLHFNQISLAKEQCQICAQLLKKTSDTDIFSLKDFDQLLEEAGDFEELSEEFTKITDITEKNAHHGTKVALNLATHHIANRDYKKAESLLKDYRDRYLDYLKINLEN